MGMGIGGGENTHGLPMSHIRRWTVSQFPVKTEWISIIISTLCTV